MEMLNKVKIVALVQSIVLIVRLFAPTMEFPEGFSDAVTNLIEALVVAATVFLAWKTRESAKTVANLSLKRREE